MKKRVAISLVFLLLAAPACMADGPANVKAVLKAYVEGRYHWSNVRIEDLVMGNGQPGGLPESISIIKEPPGKTVFGLGFAGGLNVTATAVVTGYVNVVKSTHLLRINSVVGPGDVASSPVEASRLPKDGFFKEDSQVVGQVLTCSVGSGVTIMSTMVSKAPLVNRGHKVTIMVDSPSFRITTAGELVESARVGGNAKVMNLSSRKMLSGILVDENTVRIREVPFLGEGRSAEAYQAAR